MATKNIVCARCEKEGAIELTPSGYLPEPWQMKNWYWSDNDQCFYCSKCSYELVSNTIKVIRQVCEEHGTKIIEF